MRFTPDVYFPVLKSYFNLLNIYFTTVKRHFMTFTFIIMCERIHSVVFVALCSSQYIKYKFGSDLSRFHSLFYILIFM